MRRLVLIAAIYAALTACFLGRAARPADRSEAPLAKSPAAAASEDGASQPLFVGRVL